MFPSAARAASFSIPTGYTVGDFELNVPQENRPNLTTEEVSGNS